jgi:uncharacterized protein YdeI (BOF family)
MKRSLAILGSSLLVVAMLLIVSLVMSPHVQAAPHVITPIGTARAAGAGWSGTLQGNLTLAPGSIRPDTFAFQDATGGMYVFVASGSGVTLPPLQLGDVVQVTGTLKDYGGLLEIDPISGFSRIGSGTVPAPQAISTSATIVSPTQGLIVQVSGTATWSTPQTLGADWSFTLNDGSGPITIFVDKDTAIDLRSATSGSQMIITGFSGNNAYTPQIMPRFQADIVVFDVIPPTVTSVMPVNDATNVSPYKPITATFSEPISVTTLNNATFTLINSTESAAGTIGYDEATRMASFTPNAALSPATRYTATLGTGITDRAGNPMAAPYAWSFITGAADTYPPFVVSKEPAASATNVPLNSSIVITFNEELKPSTVIAANFTLVGPQGTIGWSGVLYDPIAKRVTLLPQSLVPNASHTINISPNVTDWAGNPVNSATRSWSFTTAAELVMHAYFGDLHNHTSYSDGSLTPPLALAAGKAASFDFMAITDHSYAIDDSEWASTLQAVNDATIPGSFVAVRGAEYTQGAEGHINVYNTVRHPCRTNSGVGSMCDYAPNLENGVTVIGFYNWLAITGTQAVDSAGSLAQFNHPGWINFNDWTYHPEVSPTMRLEEVGNGSGGSYVFSEDEYIRSLDYGWKLGATNNADTHSPYWGTNTDHRTGVWMQSLTKTDLLAALRARRTFATEDKNYALSMKANGVWMGSEIPNTGSIAFEITGADPDNEGGVVVQLITFGGQVMTQTTTASSNFTWNPIVPVTPGVHYFYVKVTQPDGDRIVSSPIWTTANVNLAVTDLSVEPTIATIYNPSLITARITNRMDTTQTVTVTFQINGATQAVLTTAVPPCVTGPCTDAYPAITWQPTITGPVTVTAFISGVPAGDNPDDNTRTITMNATDEKVPLVLIDAGHGNVASTPRDVRSFVNDLTAHGFNVLLNLDQIDASDLNTETVKLLVINAYGPDQFTVTETQNIANFVNAGGSLWLNGLADYTGKISWAGTTSNRFNELLTALQTTTGYTIPIRFNSDEVLDGNDNNGYPWGVIFHNFPSAAATGIGMNVQRIETWSGNSFVNDHYTALTQADLGANGYLVAVGDLDPGTGLYGDLNRTYNDDSNKNALSPYYPYTTTNDLLPGAAAYDIPGPAGRLFFYGDANDPFNIFAYTAGDGNQNELFNLEAVMWLLGQPVQKSTIAQARAYDVVNQPKNLHDLVWIEGKVTAAFGEFFNVLYVQDDTGGITIHAPAGDISATQYLRGAQVRVLGTIDQYQGDTEVEFNEAEQVQVLTPTNGIDPAPLPLTTHAASLESNQGWLSQITGTVTAKNGESVIVDDGSGPVRAFLDGYNGTWDDVHPLDKITVRGMVSEDFDGPRIRVRNHGMHPLIPDDVTFLFHSKQVLLPVIMR